MSINLTDPIFNNEDAAYKHFESIRWPDGPICPHCGVIGEATKLMGKSIRAGLYKCETIHGNNRHRLRRLAYPIA